MSKNVRVRPEQFSKAVIDALAEYGDEANEKLETITKTIARETRKEMKATSPVGKMHRYAAGWSNKAQKTGRFNLSQVVYNRTDYQLIHLLEKPHDTGGGGHYPHKKDYTGIMKRVEEEYSQKYMDEVVEKL